MFMFGEMCFYGVGRVGIMESATNKTVNSLYVAVPVRKNAAGMRILLIYFIYIVNYLLVSLVVYGILAALHVAIDNPRVERVLDAIMAFGGLAIIALFLIFSRIYLFFGIDGPAANTFAVVFIFLLYEPLCVTLFKGTLGHYLRNFRVVSASGGRVNILIAFVRFAIKSVLGIFSFVLWFLGDRRALQDILTNTRTEYR